MEQRRRPSFKWFLAAFALLLLAPPSAEGAGGSHAGQALAKHRRGHAHLRRTHRAAQLLTGAAGSRAARPAGLVLLGEEHVRDEVSVLAAGEARAFEFRARSSGAALNVHVYLGGRNTATSMVAGLYATSAGQPGALLTSGTLSSTAAGAWNSVPVASRQLIAGSTYWLAVLGNGGQLRIRDRREGSCMAAASLQRSSVLAGSWRTSSLARTCPVSAYVTGSPSEPKLEEPIGERPPVPEPPVEEPPAKEPPAKEPPAKEPPVTGPPVNTAPPSISGLPIEAHTLSATSGAWNGTPTSFSYHWQDCNLTGSSCANVPAATASSYMLAAGDVGHTVRVLVTASNAGGGTSASSTATVPVTGIPPVAPVNTVAPGVAGTTIEGQSLSASKGTWSGSPTSFAYQWQRCSAAGSSCAAISGATASSYALRAADVGHTVRVVVTAIGAGGSTEALSAVSAVVREVQAQGTGCFVRPSVCGFPDGSNTGVRAGGALTEERVAEKVLHSGETYSHKRLVGKLRIEGSDVRVEDSEVVVFGGEKGCSSPCGGWAVKVSGGEHIVLAHDTIGGAHETGEDTLEECVRNESGAAGSSNRFEFLNLQHCGGMYGVGTWENNYCPLNVRIPNEHYECVIDDGWPGRLIVKHNTLLNREPQTATVFLQGTFGAIEEVRIEENLMAGGGYLIYGGEEDTKEIGPLVVTGNRFARACANAGGNEEIPGEGGQWWCPGRTLENGRSEKGYWPRGGSFGVTHSMPAGYTWSGNYWDDNLEVCKGTGIHCG